MSEYVSYRRKVDVVANKMGKPEPLSFIFEYERELDGIPFHGHGGNRIVVEVNDSGVVSYLRSWPELLNPQEFDCPLVRIGEAMKIAETATGGSAVTAKLVYYGGRPDLYTHVAEPTWEVECETGDRVFVSALTGKVVQP
ncbi:MAG: PepSY domain-containing protein [Bacillota bacterium]|nr:PepSY domain-containing protein [Bacillota bacterium]